MRPSRFLPSLRRSFCRRAFQLALLHSFSLIPKPAPLAVNNYVVSPARPVPSLFCITSNSHFEDGGTSLSPLLKDLYPDIDQIYRKEVNDLEEFKLIRDQVKSFFFHAHPSCEHLKERIVTLVDGTLHSCFVKQNSILAVDIFLFITKVSEYMKSRSMDDSFIPWSAVYSYSLMSILETLSKVNLEILCGISPHCRLLEIRYPNPILSQQSEDRLLTSFTNSCVNVLKYAHNSSVHTKPSSFAFTSLSNDEISIPCGLVIQIMFYIRSTAFHDKIALNLTFYERLVDSFLGKGISPATAESLLTSIEMESCSAAKLCIQRKIFHYLASLRSTRILHRLKETGGHAKEIYHDIPTMNIIILNLFIRSLSPSNYGKRYSSTSKEEDELLNRKRRGDFSLAMKFYSQIISNSHPCILKFCVQKDFPLRDGKRTSPFSTHTLCDYDHLQLLQHSTGCALLAQGRTMESFKIFESLWEPFTLKSVKHLSLLRAGFIEDLFNTCFEFSVHLESIFLPLMRMLGFSVEKIDLNSHTTGLWGDLFSTRPSAIRPLFYILACASSNDSALFCARLLTSWKQWIYRLHDEYLGCGTTILLPWSHDNSKPNGVVFVEVSKSTYPELTRRDFLWTPFLLDLLFPVIYHSIRSDRMMLYSPYYGGISGKNGLPFSFTPFSDIYFGSLCSASRGRNFAVSPFVLKFVSLFLSKELICSSRPVFWNTAFTDPCTPPFNFCELFRFASNFGGDTYFTALQVHLNAFDETHLSSLVALCSKLSFEVFAKAVCFYTCSLEKGQFDAVKSRLIFLLAGTKYAIFSGDISALTEKSPSHAITPRTSYALVVYYFKTIALARKTDTKFGELHRTPLLSRSSVLLCMKALALSNHWYDFFTLVKNFIALIPFGMKGILWTLKDSFQYVSTPDSDLLFPKVKVGLQGLPEFAMHVPIIGDTEKASVAVDALIDVLHCSNLFILNKFELHQQLCLLFETKLNVQTVFCLRHGADWDRICCLLVEHLEIPTFSVCSHAQGLSSEKISKKLVVKEVIIEPLKAIVGTTDFMKCLSKAINHEFECIHR
ncbi:hypothetical protein DI09_155p20 [Mitosporidium daphniae]|uniref:Uncharacterized protein n=1 Tax=Mitosporidium daphniae TaxID=1485682 RepID=A0A098VUP6_9MICR|nr:uncharacterized protein DI09_155p20 [Mitosporidium daphniae]KGG52589.1 hypothetical protein DI09_155p20 [Mitosporidium daphniae]|eukprot:XP_013239025.1 uncharacterized protein DI09_155p20 [Mitosporidium daphniae]